MGFERFGLQLAARLILIMAALAALGYLIVTPGQYAATVLALAVVAGLTWEVLRFVSRTNQEVARFLDAARYADFGQRFEFTNLGAGFTELGATFTHILDRFREDRKEHERELRHLKALLEHVPVPLISVHADEHVTLWNNSARRLFGNVRVARLADLEQFGADFVNEVRTIAPGERHLVAFRMDDTEQRLTLSASEIIVASATERLISLQNIQSELDGMQLSAWQDLVRVLTHEIMNSITPVSSLAKTAVDMVDDVSDQVAGQPDIVAELADVRTAVDAVARRSDGLMSFVEGYRRLTRLPTPDRSTFRVADLFADVRKLASGWTAGGLSLSAEVTPSELDLYADRQMIEQVLINLMQNSEHALEGRPQGHVTLSARLNRNGNATIEVSDNGPGIAPEIAEKIFVPFYTTRADGSGVGLALSRQVMIAHGGTIGFANNERGGARFTLSF